MTYNIHKRLDETPTQIKYLSHWNEMVCEQSNELHVAQPIL